MHKLPSHKQQVAHERRDPFLQNYLVFLVDCQRGIAPEKAIKTMLIGWWHHKRLSWTRTRAADR